MTTKVLLDESGDGYGDWQIRVEEWWGRTTTYLSAGDGYEVGSAKLTADECDRLAAALTSAAAILRAAA